MRVDIDLGDDEEDERGVEFSDGKPLRMSRRCSTCIGWDDDRMHLKPGRREEMLRHVQMGGGPVVCHQTLDYGSHPDHGRALCHWVYTQARDSTFVQLAERFFGGFTAIDPPEKDK